MTRVFTRVDFRVDFGARTYELDVGGVQAFASAMDPGGHSGSATFLFGLVYNDKADARASFDDIVIRAP